MAGSNFKFYNVNYQLSNYIYNDAQYSISYKLSNYIYNDAQYSISYTHKINPWDQIAAYMSTVSINNPHFEEAVLVENISYAATLKNLYNGPMKDEILVESRENNLTTQYDTKMSLYYKIDDRLILIDSKSTISGDAIFSGVNPGLTYHIMAEDITNNYQSKIAPILIEHTPDKDANIEIITTPVYDGYRHEFYFKVYSLVNTPTIYVSSEVGVPTVENIIPKNGENTYKVTLLSASRFYNFTITVEEARTSGNKITTKELKNISGANDSSSTITAEYFGSDVLFNISVANVIPDQINYYYSTTSMNPASMPAATSTIYSSKHRVNYGYNSIDHYIIFGIVKNGVETLSNEFVINKDPLSANVIYYAPFEQDFSDKSVNNIAATSVGTTSIIAGGGATGTGCLRVTGESYVKIPINVNVGAGDFTIEMYYRYLNTDSFANNGMFAFDTNDGEIYSLIQCNLNNSATSVTVGISITGSAWAYNSAPFSIQTYIWNHLEVSRIGSNVYFFVNGVSIATLNAGSASVTQKGINTFLGRIANNLGALTAHEFQHVRVTKGVARRSTNASFTPPRRFI